MMAEYLPLENFKKIYVVDLCKSLCKQAKKKVNEKGWKNVEVVEGDACTFAPPTEKVTLVTFSYSLSSEFSHDDASDNICRNTGARHCMQSHCNGNRHAS